MIFFLRERTETMGEVWTHPNAKVRGFKNYSVGRNLRKTARRSRHASGRSSSTVKWKPSCGGSGGGAMDVRGMRQGHDPLKADRRSAEARSYRHWYWTAQWRAIAKAQLRDEPLCRYCAKAGKVTPATVCDHVVPHKGDIGLFWNIENLQSLCSQHHNGSKAMEEARGYSNEISLDGWPICSNHPSNKLK